MSQPDRSELFLGWNLASSDEDHPLSSEAPRSRTRRPMGRGKSWDETRSIARPSSSPAEAHGDDPVADFMLHPDIESSRLRHTPDADTTGPRRDEARDEDFPIPFPRCGEAIGGFRLVSELGRGAFGRVYLAEESGLGNRPVALKVTRPEGDEPRLLARLQHTHIVPIHSVVDDPESGLRLMCMPYFGGANLAKVLDAAGSMLMVSATGRSLIEALDNVGSPAPSQTEVVSLASRKRRDSVSNGIVVSHDSSLARLSPTPRSIFRRIAR